MATLLGRSLAEEFRAPVEAMDAADEAGNTGRREAEEIGCQKPLAFEGDG